MKRLGRRRRCLFGWHHDYDRTYDRRFVWCRHCGKTWKAVYDGWEASYVVVRSMRFGRRIGGPLVPPRPPQAP